MAWSSEIKLVEDASVASSPTTTITIKYKYQRVGADMKYAFYVYATLGSSASFRYDAGRLIMWLNGTKIYDNSSWKPKQSTSQSRSGSGWPATLNWAEFTVANKTSGTTPFRLEFYDAGDYDYYYPSSSSYKQLTVAPANSSIGTITAGSTKNGPTINTTKYSSGFYDVLTLSHGNVTITREDFASSQIEFTQDERLSIFGEQGANTTQSWNVTLTSYTDSTKASTVGTAATSTVNITTEKLATITSVSDFDVEDPTVITTSCDFANGTNDYYKVYAKVGSTSGTSCYTSSNKTSALTNESITPTASTIYSSNSTSQNGTLYWVVESYITHLVNNVETGELIGTTTTTCTYNFLKSRCGPSMTATTGLQYKVTDQGTIDLLGATNSYCNYGSGTNLNKLISGKTTLKLKVAGTVNTSKSATLSRYNITVPGQTITYVSGQTEYDTRVLSASGTVSASITDSRGFTSDPISFTYTLNSYSVPSINDFKIERLPKSTLDANQDRRAKLTFNITSPYYTADTSKNFEVGYYYKEVSASTWTYVGLVKNTDYTISAETSGTRTVANINNVSTGEIFLQTNQYLVYLVVFDYYHTKASSTVANSTAQRQIPVSAPLLAKRLRRLGINKIPDTYDGTTKLGLDVADAIRTDSALIAGSYLRVGTTAEVGNNLTVNGQGIFPSGVRGKTLNAGGGTSGFMYVCDITVSGAANYQNQIMKFDVLQRGRMGYFYIGLTNSSTMGAVTVSTFKKSGDISVCYRCTNNILSVYIQKSESYDNIEVCNIEKGSYMVNTFITWKNQTVSELPDGIIYATDYLLDKIYPVGSIYMSMNNVSPQTFLGGSWLPIQSTFLYAGKDDYELSTDTSLVSGKTYYEYDSTTGTYSAYTGTTGVPITLGLYEHIPFGSTAGERAHTLEAAEIPTHNHGSKSLTGQWTNNQARFPGTNSFSGIMSTVDKSIAGYWGETGGTATNTVGFKIDATHTHSNFGSGLAHNNMPPYLKVYMWKRTA